MGNPFFKNIVTCEQEDFIENFTTYSIFIPNFCAFENIPSNFELVNRSYKVQKLINGLEQYYATFQCKSCNRFITFSYVANGASDNLVPYDFNFNLVGIKFPFDNKIKENFPDFYNIYMDTLKADKMNLSEIVGMGYRKALENIVFSYIKQNDLVPDKDLKKLNLYKAIEKLSPQLIKTAHISRLVGNNQAHFDSSKNSDLTIADQKRSLSVVVKQIEMYLDEKEFDDKYDETKNN